MNDTPAWHALVEDTYAEGFRSIYGEVLALNDGLNSEKKALKINQGILKLMNPRSRNTVFCIDLF